MNVIFSPIELVVFRFCDSSYGNLSPINFLEGIHKDIKAWVTASKFVHKLDYTEYLERLERLPTQVCFLTCLSLILNTSNTICCWILGCHVNFLLQVCHGAAIMASLCAVVTSYSLETFYYHKSTFYYHKSSTMTESIHDYCPPSRYSLWHNENWVMYVLHWISYIEYRYHIWQCMASGRSVTKSNQIK